MSYAIVSFDDTNETDFLPVNWMIDEDVCSVPVIIESKKPVRFYWPPFRNLSSVSSAKKQCRDPECGWPIYTARILSTAVTEEEARVKTLAAEDTSNVEVAETSDRKRKMPHRYVSSSEEDHEGTSRNTAILRKRKVIKIRSAASSKKSNCCVYPARNKPTPPYRFEKSLSVAKNKKSPDVSHSVVANPLCDAHLQNDQVAGLDIAVSSPSNHAHISQMNTVYQASNPDNRGLISLPPVNGVNSVEVFERGSPPAVSIPSSSLNASDITNTNQDQLSGRREVVDDHVLWNCQSINEQSVISVHTLGFSSDAAVSPSSDAAPRHDLIRSDTAITPVACGSRSESLDSTNSLSSGVIRTETRPPRRVLIENEGMPSSGVTTKFLLRLLTGIEELRHTQTLHSAMLQTLLRQRSGEVNIATVPDGMNFPMNTTNDIDDIERELGDNVKKSALVAILVECGGSDIVNFIKRTMKFLFNADLARQLNLTGQRGKRAFQSLRLFHVLYEAAKQNDSSKECTKKTFENTLQNWFSNSRDRGPGGRKGSQENRQPLRERTNDNHDDEH